MASNNLRKIVKEIQYKHDFNVEQIAQSIGYSRVHLQKEMQKKEPSRSIIRAIEDKYGDVLQNVSPTTQNVASISDFNADYGHDFSARAIFNLSESNRLIAESNASLAKSNELLSHKVESIARGSEEIALAVAAQLAAVRDLLMEQSLRSGAYSSPLAFEKAYNKKADEFLKKTKEGGTLDGAGKKNKVKS